MFQGLGDSIGAALSKLNNAVVIDETVVDEEGFKNFFPEIKFDDSQVDIVALESVRLRSSRSSGRHPRGSRIRFRPKQSNSVSDSQDEAQENTSGSTDAVSIMNAAYKKIKHYAKVN